MNSTALVQSFQTADMVVGRRVATDIRRSPAPALWLTMHPDGASGVHNFTSSLLAELRGVIDALRRTGGTWDLAWPPTEVGYLVVRSSDPEYFSVGGDLQHFRACIDAGDEAAMRAYSMQCLELLADWSALLKDRMTTVSLVQGRALGGGFEMALSADYIIAEEHSSFGFPEIMFGLFPCTGAMGLLSRRVGPVQAERMMTNNRIYTARELHAMGLIDELCPTGHGERATELFIQRHAARRQAFLKVQQSRMRMAPLDLVEAMRVVEDWVELAMHLDRDASRALDMLILMQQGARREAITRMAA